MNTPRNKIHSPTTKAPSADADFSEIPSSLEVALNGTPDPQTTYTKSTDGLLNPDVFRRLSISTIASDMRSRSRSNTRFQSSNHDRTWKSSLLAFWQRNRGLWLVAISQFFGALMNVTTRLLELEGDGMNPMQILFVRMGMTGLCCCCYMWYKDIPDFPLGPKDVRGLLVARGLTGFFGIFGMYYSLQYLPLADAVVITFLAPAAAGYACYILRGEVFTKTEQLASFVSLLGVVFIARPFSFMNPDDVNPSVTGSGNSTSAITSRDDLVIVEPTTAQRWSAIAVALLGVLGAAGAYTTIRWIGKRAHPLISVNYFATWCTFVSTTVLLIGPHLPAPLYSPSLTFSLPHNPKQWFELLFLGLCGFIMQFLLTSGISAEKSNRATNMVYTNMLFALAFDRWIFGIVPGVWSLLGCGLILGGAVWVALAKGDGNGGKENSGIGRDEEELGMLEASRREENADEPLIAGDDDIVTEGVQTVDHDIHVR